MDAFVSQATSRNSFVSVIIPAYKEEEHIEDTVSDLVAEFRRAQFEFEVIVILDYVPNDDTILIVRKLCERFGEVQLVERPGKRGVGDAIRTGIRLAKGNILVPVMADHSESPQDLVRLVSSVAEGYDVAIGDRFKDGKPHGYPFLKYLANRCCNQIIRFLFRVPSSDTTNAFKAYRTELLRQLDLSSKGFEIFAEIPLKLFLKLPNAKVTNIRVQHFVRKKKEAKLSLVSVT